MQTITTAFRDLKTALRVSTTRLAPDERLSAIALAELFLERLKIEAVADRHGWEIPAYGSAEWMEMQRAFSEEIS